MQLLPYFSKSDNKSNHHHDELKNKDGLDMDFLKKVDPDLFGWGRIAFITACWVQSTAQISDEYI